MQEIVYLIMNDVDVMKAREKSIEDRFTFLEIGLPGAKTEMEKMKGMPRPRLIKTHMPYEMMESQVNVDKSKHIVVMRNPKDNLVSTYYFYRSNRGLGLYPGTWDQFFEEFIRSEELVTGCPVDYNIGWWKNKDKDNVFIITYEEMKANLRGSVEKVAKFLEKELTSEQFDRLEEAVSFKTMQENPSTNYQDYASIDQTRGKFIRKGIVGDWQNHFSTEQNDYMDGVLKKLEGTGLSFKFTE